MMNTKTIPRRSHEEASLDDCEAMLICLQSKRFVVVRCDEPKDLWPVQGGWDNLRSLCPGDEVIYKGDRAVVRALEVYR